MTRSGFVAVVGRPNVGKSTLLNRLVGQKLAITSPRPQSTRDRVTGILTFDDTQIVLVDTPGLLEPTVALQHVMRATALQALRDSDVILHLVDVTEREPKSLGELAGFNATAPILVARTKADLLPVTEREKLRLGSSPDECIVSALTGEGMDDLRARLSALLPEGPFLYPDDDVSTQHLRFFAAELVRETTLEQLDEEVPHAIACVVEEFREDRSPVYIRAVIYVERESQKRIVIGSGGTRIREIGRAARLKIEEDLVSSPVFLDLWVKVLPNWRRDKEALRRLGYTLPEVPRS